MKINEVEALVEIPKKSIRFYEDEGLLHPVRDQSNGYRDYTKDDVTVLKRIKIYRKLALPIEEIKKILYGHLTVKEALERQKIVLNHERKNLEQQSSICDEMMKAEIEDKTMDTDLYLNRIAQLENAGVQFLDIEKADNKKKKNGVWLSVIGFAIVILGFGGLFFFILVKTSMPWWLFVVIEVMFILPAAGVFIAGYCRIKEINGGEENDISKY